MKTVTTNTRRSGLMAAGAASVLAVAAMGFAGAAEARDNLSFSIGISSPGVQVGVNNAYPVYAQPYPVYVQPRPVYVQPRPVYVQPRPVYVQPQYGYVQPAPVYYGPQPVYVQPAPVYRGDGYRHGRRHHGFQGHHQGYQSRHGHNPNYAPIYYGR